MRVLPCLYWLWEWTPSLFWLGNQHSTTLIIQRTKVGWPKYMYTVYSSSEAHSRGTLEGLLGSFSVCSCCSGSRAACANVQKTIPVYRSIVNNHQQVHSLPRSFLGFTLPIASNKKIKGLHVLGDCLNHLTTKSPPPKYDKHAYLEPR